MSKPEEIAWRIVGGYVFVLALIAAVVPAVGCDEPGNISSGLPVAVSRLRYG